MNDRQTLLTLSDGSIEFLKWLALVFMTVDHVNKYLFNFSLPYAFEIGRLALPLFVIVFGYNLARVDVKTNIEMCKRALAFALISLGPQIAIGGTALGSGSLLLPLNVMWTLLSISVVVLLARTHNISLSILVAVTAGFLVEFYWYAIALGVSTWFCFTNQSFARYVTVIITCASLSLVNQNHMALLSIPLVILISFLRFDIPRFRWAFYTYYPLHLLLLWPIRAYLRSRGYILF